MRFFSVFFAFLLAGAFASLVPTPLSAQESPYFVAYDHYLEEPGNLELAFNSTFGTQRHGNDYYAYWAELEYGVTAWWTSEVYLSGQSTFSDSSVFTGVRWENRIRPLRREHFINPVLYVEYEHISEADKTIREVEGHDVEDDFLAPNKIAGQKWKNELEFKVLLSSNYKGWNFAENFIASKSLSSDPWEFGYALGASRPLALKASATRCSLCAQRFTAGLEMFGGLGDRHHLGLQDTSHYLAPAVAWNLPSGWTVRLSPAFGLNGNSHQLLLRWGISREISGFGEMLREFLRGKR